MHSMRFQFDEEFIRRALRSDHLGRMVYLVGLVLVVGGLALFVGDFRPQVGWLLLGILVVALLVKERQFRARVARTVELWREAAPGGEVGFDADDHGLVVVTERGAERYPWSSIRRLRRWSHAWGMETDRGNLLLFPVEQASPEMAAFVGARCRAGALPPAQQK